MQRAITPNQVHGNVSYTKEDCHSMTGFRSFISPALYVTSLRDWKETSRGKIQVNGPKEEEKNPRKKKKSIRTER